MGAQPEQQVCVVCPHVSDPHFYPDDDGGDSDAKPQRHRNWVLVILFCYVGISSALRMPDSDGGRLALQVVGLVIGIVGLGSQFLPRSMFVKRK